MNREEIKLYKDLLNDTKEQLSYEIIQKNRELDKLEDVIYKAIKEIEHSLQDCFNDTIHNFDLLRLLDILKGSDKE